MTLEDHVASFERSNGRLPQDLDEMRAWYTALLAFNNAVTDLAKQYIGPNEQIGLLATRASAAELAEVEAVYDELRRFKSPACICASFLDEIMFPRNGAEQERQGRRDARAARGAA